MKRIVILRWLLVLLIGTCVQMGVYGQLVKAELQGSTDNGCSPHAVTFQNQTLNYVPNQTHFRITWGDGSSQYYPPQAAMVPSFSHTYNLSTCNNDPVNPLHLLPNGNSGYSVKLTAWKTGSEGDSTTSTKEFITVYGQTDARLSINKRIFCLSEMPVTISNVSKPDFCASTFSYFVYNWGDGTIIDSLLFSHISVPVIETRSHSFTTPGTYKISLRAYNYLANEECNPTYDTITIKVLKNPLAITSIPDTAVCLNASGKYSVSPSNGSTGDSLTYRWQVTPNTGVNFIGGTNSTTQFPQIEFSQAGVYNIKLVASNPCISDSMTVRLRVRTKPTVDFNFPDDSVCGGINLYPSPIIDSGFAKMTAYNWTFTGGAPASSTAKIPGGVVYATPGNYTITFTATNQCGVSNTKSKSFRVEPTPVASLTTPGSFSVCTGQKVNLLLNSCSTCKYAWYRNGILIPDSTTTHLSVAKGGSYYARVYRQYSSTFVCPDTTPTVTVAVNPIPSVPVAGTPSRCGTGSVTLTATLANSADSLVWYAAASGGTPLKVGSTYATPSISSTTTFYVSERSVSGCESARVPVVATINPLPTATLSANGSLAFCIGPSRTLTATTVPTTGITYKWLKGGTVIAGATSSAFTTSTSGIYRAEVTITSTGCKDTSLPLVLTVHPKPTLTVEPPFSICRNALPKKLTESPMGGTWSGSVALSGDTFTPSAVVAGAYTLTYSYTDSNTCSNTATTTATVNPVPVVNIGSDSSYCNTNTNITLPGSGSGTWSGNGVSANQFNPSVAGAGNHILAYVSTNGFGCSFRDTVVYNVFVPTTVFAGNDTSVCLNAPTFVLSGSPTGGVWSGTGVSGGSFNPSVAGVGVKTLTYTLGTGICKRTDTKDITVKALPNFTVMPAFAVCATDTGKVLTASVAGGTWSGTGVSAGVFRPTVSGVGSFTLTYLVTDVSGCSNTKTVSATVNALPTITPNPDSSFCFANVNIPLVGTGVWSGLGVSANQFNPSVAGLGAHPLVYTFTDGNGCIARDTAKYSVVSPVVPIVGNDTGVCLNNGPLALKASPIGGTWSGAGVTDTIFHPSVAGVGAKILTYTTGVGLCLRTATKTVTVYNRPVPNYTVENVCSGKMVNLPSTSSAGSINGGILSNYNWNFAGLGTGTGSVGKFTFADSGTYAVTLLVTDANGCDSSITKNVRIHPLPVPTVGVADTCFGISAHFSGAVTVAGKSATISPSAYKWTFGEGGANGTGKNSSYAYLSSGIKTVQLAVTDSNGCTDTATRVVNILAPPTPTIQADSVCLGAAMQFGLIANAPRGVDSVFWNFAGKGSSTVLNPSFVFDTARNYVVGLRLVDSAGCVGNATRTVKVNAAPTAKFVPSKVCLGDSLSFADASIPSSGAITYYKWIVPTLPDTVQKSQFKVLFSVPGKYEVKLIVGDNNACSGTFTDTVQVYRLPQPIINLSDSVVCQHESLTYRNGNTATDGNITVIRWKFHNGTQSLSDSVVKAWPTAGLFTVQLKATSELGCADSVSSTFRVSANPIAKFVADTVCFGTATTFTDSSLVMGAPLSKWQWQFTPSNNSSVTNPTFSFDSAGNYMVQLIATDLLGCADTVTGSVKVNKAPRSAFTFANVCLGDSAHFVDASVASDGAIGSHKWSIDGNTFTTNNVAYLFADTGYHVVKLTVDDNNACEGVKTDSVFVYALPITGFTSHDVCLGDTATFGNTSTSTHGTASFTWYFGDGTQKATATTINVEKIYASVGNFDVKLRTVSQYGCADSATGRVRVFGLPSVDFAFDSVCANDTVKFANATTIADTTISNYLWNFGYLGQTSTLTNPEFVYPIAGLFTAQLVASDNHGCRDTTQHLVRIFPGPTAKYIAANNCLNRPTEVASTSVPAAGPILTHRWDFNNGQFIDSVASTQFTFPTSGSYPIRLSITDAKGCKAAFTDTVVVFALPQASLSAPDVCLGQKAQFTDGTFLGNAPLNHWLWKFGIAGGSSTLQNSEFLYSATGIFSVSLSVTDTNGCADTAYKNIRVFGLPTANFVADTACLTHPTAFADLSIVADTGLAQWNWHFGGATVNSSAVQLPSAVYPTSGTFTATLIVTDSAGCTDTTTRAVIVNPGPVVDFAVNRVCLRDSSFFTDLTVAGAGAVKSKPVNWKWNFGDGDTSALVNPTHKYGTQGNYSVILTVTDSSGCVSSKTNTAIVDGLPIVNFGLANVCAGDTAHLTDLTSAIHGALTHWQWNFGAGQPLDTNTNANAVYSSAGQFNITLWVTNEHNCSDSAIKPITVYSRPSANYTADTVCMGLNTAFADLSAGTLPTLSSITQWSWNFGEGGTSTQQNPTHLYDTSGIYSVSLVATDANGCRDTLTRNVVVHPLPVARFVADSVCRTFTTTLADLSTGTANVGLPLSPIKLWRWNLGQSTTDTLTYTAKQPTISKFYPLAGTYGVRLSVTDAHGCSQSFVDSVVVHPLPVVAYSHDSLACTNQPAPFANQTTGAVQYRWRFGDGGTSNQFEPSHIYTVPAYRFVKLVAITNKGCSDSLPNSRIRVILPPNAKFLMNKDTGCGPLTVSFTNISTGVYTSYKWDLGTGATSTLQSPPAVTYSAGLLGDTTYYIRLVATNRCDSSVFVDSVTVFPKPISRFGVSASAGCAPLGISFINSSVGSSKTFKWNFSATDSSTAKNPSPRQFAAGIADTTYNIRLVAFNSCGTDTSYKKITVYPNNVEAGFTLSDTIGCAPLSVKMRSISLKDGWVSTFQFGDGNFVSADSALHFYTLGGIYTITQVVSNGCATDTAKRNVVALSPPLAKFEVTDTVICVEQQLKVSNLSANYTNLSFFADTLGSLPLADTLTISFAKSGFYWLRLSAYNGQTQCADTMRIRIRVSAKPGINFTTSADSICGPGNITFYNVSGSNAYVAYWVFSNGEVSTLKEPTIFFDSVGKYTASLFVENEWGCATKLSRQVKVNPLPIPDFTLEPAFVCSVPSTFKIIEKVEKATSWYWDLGAFGAGYTDSMATLTADTFGLYKIAIHARNEFGCADTAYKKFNAYPTPPSDFRLDTTFGCVGLKVNPMPLKSESDDYQWLITNGDTVYGRFPTLQFDEPGTYSIELIASNGGVCKSGTKMRDSIVIFPKPIADFEIIKGYNGISNLVYFENKSEGGVFYFWDLDEGNTSNLNQPFAQEYEFFINHDVELIAENEFGCLDSATKQFNLGEGYGLYIPNAFMPDLLNDEVNTFAPKGSGLTKFTIRIYDLWGNQIWESNTLNPIDGSPTGKWDGTVKGTPAPSGTYVWKIVEAEFRNSSVYRGPLSGDLTLIR